MFRSCLAVLFIFVVYSIGAQASDSLETLTIEFQTAALVPEGENRLVLGTDIPTNAIVEDVSVAVCLEHPRLSDITIELEIPTGKRILLHNSESGSNLDIVYTADVSNPNGLYSVIGYPSGGTWTLWITDNTPGEIGTVIAWGLQLLIDTSKIILPTPTPEPVVCFERRQALTEFSGVSDVAFPDYNHDGILDILFLMEQMNKVEIYRNLGGGWLGDHLTFSIESPYMAVVGEFDSDGIPDLAIAGGSNTTGITTYLGTEDGNYTKGAQISVASEAKDFMAIGHLNDDALDDLILGDPPRLFFGASKGSFSGGTIVGGRGQYIYCSGDYDLDGYTDILVGLSGVGSNIDYYLIYGDESASQINQVRIIPQIQASMGGNDDIDGDGTVDFWLWGYRKDSPSSTGLQIYFGNEDRSTLGTYFPLMLTQDNPAIFICNIDEDIESEILVPRNDGLYSLEQQLNGILVESDTPLITAEDTVLVRFADFDNDNQLDILRVAENQVDIWVRTLVAPNANIPTPINPTATPTLFLFVTSTPTPSATHTASPTWTPSLTPTPTETNTPSPTATCTPTSSPTPTPTPSFTPVPSPTHTPIPTPSPSPTQAPLINPDINGDGAVNQQDLMLLIHSWHRDQ